MTITTDRTDRLLDEIDRCVQHPTSRPHYLWCHKDHRDCYLVSLLEVAADEIRALRTETRKEPE